MDSSGGAADRIHIEQLEVQAQLGVTEEERSQPQRITVSLTIWPEGSFSGLQDDIRRTVNYSEVCSAVRTLAEGRVVKLVETLADEIASLLLSEFPLGAVEVEVRKYVYPDTEYIAVIVRREAMNQQ